MIRFIDLRSQIYCDNKPVADQEVCFAFFDTVTDRFLEHFGVQTWTSVEEFKECLFEGGGASSWNNSERAFVERLLGLIPDWANQKHSSIHELVERDNIRVDKNNAQEDNIR